MQNILYAYLLITLDYLISQSLISAPNLVKMDVEGAESLVLEGARELLKTKKAVWFIALHGDEQKAKVKAILETAGYQIFRLDGERICGEIMDTDEIYATAIENF
ncbi:MAG: FkbM family methyltransferase [Methylococcaceae bacterium]|nr:FkbM family methyltransferase [Methylococcaceae bacterium]